MKNSFLVTSALFTALFWSHIVSAQDDCFRWEQTLAVGDIRYAHVMAYDSARHVFVFFGGEVIPNGPYSTEWTIEWDGIDFAVRDIHSVPPRTFSAMAFDAARGVCVLFGGDNSDRATWTWDGYAWTRHDVAGPSAQYGHAMAYDDRRQVVVMFAGHDTWEWNGGNWTLRATTGPSSRIWHAMAFDSARGVTSLFGGRGSNGLDLGDTWEWDGTTWTLRATTGPGPRRGHTMVFDEEAKRTILFGGEKAFPYPSVTFGDTWSWDGVEWKLVLSDGPTPRAWHKMAYDSDRDVIVLDGGIVPAGSAPIWTLSSCDIDSDDDGVPDVDDECPQSDLSAMLAIDGCNTGVSNKLAPNGCTMADDVNQCADQASNHGGFVSCVSANSQRWLADGLLPRAVKGDLMRCAAHADIP